MQPSNLALVQPGGPVAPIQLQPPVMPNINVPPPPILHRNSQPFVPSHPPRRYHHEPLQQQPHVTQLPHHYAGKEPHRTIVQLSTNHSQSSGGHPPSNGGHFVRKHTHNKAKPAGQTGDENYHHHQYTTSAPLDDGKPQQRSKRTALATREGTKKSLPSNSVPDSSQPDSTSQEASPLETSDSSSPAIEVSANGDHCAQVTLDNSQSSSGKEKTPMCLVNELARYNKITHQYRLTSEDGPPHKKRFTVTLNLGEEEYTSEEASIKKAQHSAAADAIVKTKYKHPPLKVNRMPFRASSQNGAGADAGNITPTVELNALAMKRGETTVYQVEVPAGTEDGPGGPGPAINNVPVTHIHVFRGLPQNYGHYGRYPPNQMYPYPPAMHRFPYDRRHMDMHQRTPPPPHYGRIAYHKPSPNQQLPAAGSEDQYKVNLLVGQRKFVAFGATLQSARHNAASKALRVLRPLTAEEYNVDTEDPNADIKSPISLIHEIVLKRGFTVEFKVLSEKGPPHMKTFITQCTAGPIVTEGEGNGKKLSKKRAAESMLVELRKLPPPSPTVLSSDGPAKPKQAKRKTQPVKKKARNLIKENPDDETEDANPISRLIHVSQSHKAKDPVYTLINEAGTPRRREFVMEVLAVGQTAQGSGSTKKLAKKKAAENLLIKMGIAISPKETVTDEGVSVVKPKLPEAETENTAGSSGRQLVPGVLILMSNDKPIVTDAAKPIVCSSPDTGPDSPKESTPTTARHLPPVSDAAPGSTVRSKDQLIYLAKLLDFEMQISDFPKGNHSELLTLITLATVPPILCHGRGSTWEASGDQAAYHVLNMLTELGLDTVCSNKKEVATTEATTIPTVSETALKESIRPKEQLVYLQKLLDFNMQISDFPKGNHSEFLTLIAVATVPPILCHGRGSTSEESGDQAAISVLQMLTEWGLDSLQSGSSVAGEPVPSGPTPASDEST